LTVRGSGAVRSTGRPPHWFFLLLAIALLPQAGASAPLPHAIGR